MNWPIRSRVSNPPLNPRHPFVTEFSPKPKRGCWRWLIGIMLSLTGISAGILWHEAASQKKADAWIALARSKGLRVTKQEPAAVQMSLADQVRRLTGRQDIIVTIPTPDAAATLLSINTEVPAYLHIAVWIGIFQAVERPLRDAFPNAAIGIRPGRG